MNALVRWMKDSGLRKVDVARALDIQASEVQRYCREGYWPTKAIAIRILRLTGGSVTPTQFLLGAEMKLVVIHTREYRAGQAAIKEAAARRQEKEDKHAQTTNPKSRAVTGTRPRRAASQ
jgi:plasmid maintenance system antidote protein VapI